MDRESTFSPLAKSRQSQMQDGLFFVAPDRGDCRIDSGDARVIVARRRHRPRLVKSDAGEVDNLVLVEAVLVGARGRGRGLRGLV